MPSLSFSTYVPADELTWAVKVDRERKQVSILTENMHLIVDLDKARELAVLIDRELSNAYNVV